MGHHGLTGRALLLASFVLVALLCATPFARASKFGIAPGGFAVRMLDSQGDAEGRAGSHPDLLEIAFSLDLEGTAPRDLVFDMPPGFSGNPKAVPECPRETYDAGEECPPETLVGSSKFRLAGGQEVELPIFLLEPEPGQVIAFGSKPGFGLPLTFEFRPGDFGATLSASNPQQVELSEGHIQLWGVPVDHQQGTSIPRRALLTAPTRCGPMAFAFRTRSWEEDSPWLGESADTGTPLVGCQDLEFEPRLGLRLDNPVADSPTGVRVELEMPTEEDPDGLSQAQLKSATFQLPPGLGISPSGVQRLVPCTEAEFAPESPTAPLCPHESRVGSVELSSPLMPEELVGDIYLGEERPGERFRMLVAIPVPGVVLKFSTAFHPDPATGRLTAKLEGLPEVAISRLSLDLGGGPEALIVSPVACGPVLARGSFEPYGGGETVETTASAGIAGRVQGSPCPGPGPFEPELAVRASHPRAGRLTAFSALLRRRDGEQLPRRFSVTLPAGLSASLGSVEPCGDADAAAGACPASSRIGTATVEVGTGARPVALPGGMFVTGPYGRAPFGLLLRFHSSIGPFDLGVLAMRAGADLDRRSGRVTVSVERIPDVVEGVPIRFRLIELSLDRSGLVRNPTSCASRSVDARVESQGGTSIAISSPFALSGCRRLGFRPHIGIALRGTGAGGSPSLRISARTRSGDANLRALNVSFPPVLEFRIGQLREICSSTDARFGACPDGSRVGSVSARTPLLGRPLRGSIYVVQPRDDGQPDLALSLAAGDVHFDFRAQTALRDGRLVTRLAGLPDMPFESLTMELGGKRSNAFSIDRGICSQGGSKRPVASIHAKAQNGARRLQRLPVSAKVGCADRRAAVTRPVGAR